jgi:hypothetical protein
LSRVEDSVVVDEAVIESESESESVSVAVSSHVSAAVPAATVPPLSDSEPVWCSD